MAIKNILFLVRSVPPFFSNRKDIDDIILKLVENGNRVDIYDTKRKLHISVNDKIETDYNFWPKWFFVGKAYLGLNFFVLIYFCLKNQGKYDFVQINYCREEFQLIPQLIKGLGKKLYIFFYGSDLNDRNFVKNNFKKLFYISDKLIATNRSIYKILDKYFDKKRIDDKKTVIFLPQEHFKLYEPFNFSDKVSFKKQLGIPENRIVVMVGNNGTENEQHEKMIDQLQNLENLENYFFIILFSNRLDTSGIRLKKVSTLANEKLGESNFRLISDFVSHKEIAALRMSSDIFLHLRKIDMLAASMFESNMAFCQIITGDWLPYEYYLEKVKVEVISGFNQINPCIKKVLSDEHLNEKLNHNREVVLTHYHYNVIDDWMKLYE